MPAVRSTKPDSSSKLDEEIKKAEQELMDGSVDAAFARLGRLQQTHGEDPMLTAVLAALGAPVDASGKLITTASSNAAAEHGTLKRASTMASLPAKEAEKLTSVPRGGTLVKLVGTDGLKKLGLEKQKNRMGRVIEMVGRQYLKDGVTELATVLLDSRVGDYDRGNGAWVQVPLANIELV